MTFPRTNFDISQSTEWNYRRFDSDTTSSSLILPNHFTIVPLFHGPFLSIRQILDYTYHSYYTHSRQSLQDSIIIQFLLQQERHHRRHPHRKQYAPTSPWAHCFQSVNIPTVHSTYNIHDHYKYNTEDRNHLTHPQPQYRWIVFTAGAMGSGKSYTIQYLHSKGRFPLDTFITVDPDEIRRELPEFDLYLKDTHYFPFAGEMTRKEAGYIAEIIVLVALAQGRNVLVDGSLRDASWYQHYFQKLRHMFQPMNLRISILHVISPTHLVFERAENRSRLTGRSIPRETILQSIQSVPESVRVLAPLSDFFVEIYNDASNITLLNRNMTWENFQDAWNQP